MLILVSPQMLAMGSSRNPGPLNLQGVSVSLLAPSLSNIFPLTASHIIKQDLCTKKAPLFLTALSPPGL